jgi:secreted trypsin-like serine protease
MSCLLSLAIDFVLFVLVAFSSTPASAVVYITIMVAELAVAAAFAVSVARWRDSPLSLAFCGGRAAGICPSCFG